MTYIIGEKVNAPNDVYHVENKREAEVIVKEILDNIRLVLNQDLLVITRKEDDVTVKWDGNLMVRLLIREDDEVDLSVQNEQQSVSD